jgi:hypothetical protein
VVQSLGFRVPITFFFGITDSFVPEPKSSRSSVEVEVSLSSFFLVLIDLIFELLFLTQVVSRSSIAQA